MRVAFLIAVIIFSVSSSVFAASFAQVSPAYGPDTPGWQVTHFSTIQDGVSAVDPGGIVVVSSGSYSVPDPILIDKGLTLRGPQADRLITDLELRHPGDTLLEAVVDFGMETGGLILESEVTIKGFDFVGSPSLPMIRTQNSFKTREILVHGNLFRCLDGTAPSAISLRNVEMADIKHNFVSGFAGEPGAIAIVKSELSYVRFNEVTETRSTAPSAAAIYVSSADGVSISDNRIHKGIASNGIVATDEPPPAQWSFGLQITDNFISDFSRAGIAHSAAFASLTANEITNVNPDSPLAIAGIYVGDVPEGNYAGGIAYITQNRIHNNRFSADAPPGVAGIRSGPGNAIPLSITFNILEDNYDARQGIMVGFVADENIGQSFYLNRNWWGGSRGPAVHTGTGFGQIDDGCRKYVKTRPIPGAEALGIKAGSYACFSNWAEFRPVRRAFTSDDDVLRLEPASDQVYTLHSFAPSPEDRSWHPVSLVPTYWARSGFEVLSVASRPYSARVTVQYTKRDIGLAGRNYLYMASAVAYSHNNPNNPTIIGNAVHDEENMTFSADIQNTYANAFLVGSLMPDLGDATGDGFVNNQDAHQIYRIAMGLDDINDFQFDLLDVNFDGVVDLQDAEKVHRFAMGLLDE